MPKIIVTEEQWIQAGMECFAKGGAEAIVIEKMASALRCSKSSFYWYFNDRTVFLQRVVEEWRRRATLQVIESSSEEPDVDRQLRSLLYRMFSVTQRGDFLFFLRSLSEKEAMYRSTLDEVEELRMRYAKDLLVRKGLGEERAFRLSFMLYHYYLGWYERHKQEILTEQEIQQHVHMLWIEWFDS
jgi:AcrR family transcriptional regulator